MAWVSDRRSAGGARAYLRVPRAQTFIFAGETLVVQVCGTECDTAALLACVLDHNQAAAELLAAAVHQEVPLEDPALAAVAVAVSPESMAIWIDPIGKRVRAGGALAAMTASPWLC